MICWRTLRSRSGADTKAQLVRQPLWLSYLALAFAIFIVVLFGCFADTQLALVMAQLVPVLLVYYRLVVVRARAEAERKRSTKTEA